MLSWKKIEDFNLKEVASKTQIEVEFLNALVNRDFQKLSRFNVKGFIKILSKEYDLDFTEFNEEYQNFLQENEECINTKKTLTTKLDYYSKESANFGFVFFVLVLFVLIGFFVYYYDFFRAYFKEDDINSSVAVIEIIDKAQNNVMDLKTQVVIEDNDVNLSDDINNTGEQININLEENSSNVIDDSIEENITLQEKNTEKQLSQEAIFSPKDKIWIGLIDLKNYKKTSFVKDGNFTISLKEDKLILTGSAQLVLVDEKGEKFDFRSGISKRFLVKDGAIKKIDLAEFLKYNKGKGW